VRIASEQRNYRPYWPLLCFHGYRGFRIRDVDPLKSRLIEEWEHFQQMFIKSGSGVHVFELAFEHMEDILNTD